MKLESAHITNFKLLEDVSLQFSSDLARPLTVVRAENGSGKTSILYALRWAMYGENEIPPQMRLTSTAQPAGKPVQVQVRIEFTTSDPYSRAEARYRLIRTCEETPGEGDNYSRSPSRLRLLRRTDRGEEDIEEGVEGLISSVLPRNLADVFFTNGDDVQRFIAGGQHGERERQEAVHKAIRKLLGLEGVETVEANVTVAARRLRKESTSTGGREVQTAGEELEGIEDELNKQRENLSIINQRKSALDEQVRIDERALDAIKGMGDLDSIQAKIHEIEEDVRHLEVQETGIRRQMKELLRSEDLSKGFIGEQLDRGITVLAELVDRKIIPGSSLEVLIDRLQLGTCICGEELRAGTTRHNHVTSLIEEQRQVAPRLQRLTALWHEARNRATSTSDEDDIGEAVSEKASSLNRQFTECLDRQRRKNADLKAEQEKRGQIDHEQVQFLTRRLRSSRSKRSEFDREDGLLTGQIQELEEKRKVCQERFDEAVRRATLNQGLKRQSIVADDLVRLTKGTLDRLKWNYVHRVSARMNELFLEIVGADPTTDTTVFTGVNINETTYDIVIRTLAGRTLDADTELNGAAQRALTLSFIWALMEVAEREAPRIIDTPLGMTSGAVKHRMVDLLTKPTAPDGLPYQAVLFMTRSEIRDIEELISERAGLVTTLTCSKDYPVDLVNDWSDGLPVVRTCQCDHTEICGVCVRRSDSGRFKFREVAF